MFLKLTWIRNNKLKFFIFSSIILIGNLLSLKFIRTGFFIDIDLIAGFFAAGVFFGMIFLLTTIWIRVTQKYHFFFFKMDIPKIVSEKILSFLIGFFLLLNFVFMYLIWVNENFLGENLVFYFGNPWLILIFVNVNNLIENKDTMV